MRVSRPASFVITSALTLALGACASSGGNSGMSGGPVSAAMSGMQWSGTLEPTGGSTIRGSATVAPGGGNSQSTANLSVSGSTSGASHPWHLHRGSCGNDMGIVGSADAYPMVGIGADGTGRVMVGLAFPTPSSGNYFVSVHRSAQDLTPVACGNLTMGSR